MNYVVINLDLMMLEKAVAFLAIYSWFQAWNLPGSWNQTDPWKLLNQPNDSSQMARGLPWDECDNLEILKHYCAVLFSSERCHGYAQVIDKRSYGSVIQKF